MTSARNNDVILLVTPVSKGWTSVVDGLLEQGYNVETAEGGVVALSMLDSMRVDLLIIDSALGDLSAAEVIRICRLVYPASRMPILLAGNIETTGNDGDIDKEDINGVIQQPLDIEGLTARVRRLLNSRQENPTLLSEQQESASTQLERLMLINKALERKIRQHKRLEQKLRKEIALNQHIERSSPKKTITVVESEAEDTVESSSQISRKTFEGRVSRLLSPAGSDLGEHALCYLRATSLRQFEDCYGEIAKDGLVRQLLRIIQSCVRKDDSLTDIGNGEFLLLMQHCSVEQAGRLMESLCEKTHSYRFVWRDEERKVDLHTGVVPVTGANAEELIEAARKVARQRNNREVRKEVVRNDSTPSNKVVDTGSAEYLLEAMKNGRFQLHFQPIEALHRSTNPEGVRFELFLRLQDEFGRFVRPAAFLPAIERHELVSNLDRWTISTAFAWLAGHMTSRYERLALCCINLSAQSLSDERLREFIQSQFSQTGIPSHKICFEINETAAIANIKTAAKLMSELGRSGCTFALDDFGSGLSSMAYMNNLPAEYIKIDGRFVKNIAGSTVDFSTVKSINEIAHALGKKTIAEFVEDEEALKKVKEIGVDYAQGYAIGRPLPIKALLVKSLAASAGM